MVMKFETHTLDNGMRIVCAPSASRIVYCGIAVDAGTRHELPTESGMAHFTEHMSFKGTEKRTSRQIINRLETVGGDLNAYTGKEETIYYCAVPERHATRAIELLADICLHSTYPLREMQKEVEVVIDEIDSYEDSPAELIYDDFDALLFPSHPLGRTILGEAKRLREYTTADMRAFADRLYTPGRMVLYVLGNVPMRTVVKKIVEVSTRSSISISRHQDILMPGPRSVKAEHHISRDTHQAHVLLGTQCAGAASADYLPLYVLNNILGGPGMNSRLNLALRERRGLCYTVESSMVCYTDCGVWNTYFGCAPSDTRRCLRLVERELMRLTDKPLSPSQLAAAKRQLKGQLAIAADNLESVAMGMGKRMLHFGTTLSHLQLTERIDAITSEDLLRVARETFDPAHLVSLIYD